MTNNDPMVELPTRRKCGAMEVHRRLLTESESYRLARSEIENHAIEFERMEAAGARGVARIPVVVHVVSNTPEQDISEAQISSQIDVLNQDFRASNPDVSTVPPVFAGLVGDAQVEFYLATSDPVGNPTKGITRTHTNVTVFDDDDAVKFAVRGGATAWPADRYLNLWVCKLGRGLLGYAQFPGGPAATDGVVITYTAFGTTGTAAAPFNLGRTATHEIGHYLNLFHIWGDDGTGCGGSDQVDDTPNQAGPNMGMPTFPHVTCNNGPNGDLFMDYMDYTDDAGMMMFTQGQATRMAACLEGVRKPLWSAQVLPVPTKAAVPGAAGVPGPGAPTVVASGKQLDVFVTSADGTVYHKSWDGNSWRPSQTGWESLGRPGAEASAALGDGAQPVARPELASS